MYLRSTLKTISNKKLLFLFIDNSFQFIMKVIVEVRVVVNCKIVCNALIHFRIKIDTLGFSG